MRGRMAATCLTTMVATAAAPAPVPPPIVTSVSFDALRDCFRSKWAHTGRMTAINTAAGAMFDLSFPAVGDDGKVGTSHAIFSIEDRGVERRVTASAADPGDMPLAREMLDQTLATCGSETARR